MDSKVSVSGVSVEDIELDDVYQYLSLKETADGSLQGDPKVLRYIELMDKALSMQNRINIYGNKQSIINHMVLHEGLSKYKAKQIYESAREYYYSSREESKSTLRNILAEKIERLIDMSMEMVETVQDAQRIVKMIVDQAKVLTLDQQDPPKLPKMQKPFKVLSYNPDDFENIPGYNLKKLAEFVDGLENLSEPEKIKLKKEAGIHKREIPFLENNNA